MLREVHVVLKGTSPLLMHRFPMEKIEAIEKMSKEEQAEIAAYRDEHGELYVPAEAVQRSLVGAATFSKGKGRASLQKQAAACLLVTPERLLLGKQSYAIDSRPIVNPSTGGRVMRHRPRFEEWTVTFDLEYDDTLLSEVEIRRIADDAGSRTGLLDFRPACKGPFGRSMVAEWSISERNTK